MCLRPDSDFAKKFCMGFAASRNTSCGMTRFAVAKIAEIISHGDDETSKPRCGWLGRCLYYEPATAVCPPPHTQTHKHTNPSSPPNTNPHPPTQYHPTSHPPLPSPPPNTLLHILTLLLSSLLKPFPQMEVTHIQQFKQQPPHHSTDKQWYHQHC